MSGNSLSVNTEGMRNGLTGIEGMVDDLVALRRELTQEMADLARACGTYENGVKTGKNLTAQSAQYLQAVDGMIAALRGGVTSTHSWIDAYEALEEANTQNAGALSFDGSAGAGDLGDLGATGGPVEQVGDSGGPRR